MQFFQQGMGLFTALKASVHSSELAVDTSSENMTSDKENHDGIQRKILFCFILALQLGIIAWIERKR